MSSHPYVSQLNTPLDDDTTLMSTTDTAISLTPMTLLSGERLSVKRVTGAAT